MEETRVIEVKEEILAENTAAADAFRAKLAGEGCFYIDVMSSPGAGKTTLLLALIERLRKQGQIGIIEADLESFIDSKKIKEAGIPAVQLETNNICHVEMGMVESAWRAFGGQHFDYLFLENIGNLVCPADFDTGAHRRVMLLSVPEGGAARAGARAEPRPEDLRGVRPHGRGRRRAGGLVRRGPRPDAREIVAANRTRCFRRTCNTHSYLQKWSHGYT